MTTPQPTPSAPVTAAREVELKLLVLPEDLGRIVTLPFLRQMAQGEPHKRELRTVYYDTPDLRLAADSVALRVRQEGDRIVQTVKTLSDDSPSDSAGVAVRREWDWLIATPEPDLSVLEPSGAGALIPRDLRERLVPIFVTRFDRTVLLVRPDGRTTVEVAVDDGEIVAGDRRERICELELELKDGRMGRLFQMALGVLKHIPVRIAVENKAEIGYRLVTGRVPRPVDTSPVALSPITTVAEAFRHIVRQGVRQILDNEACALADGDAEGLHRIRIALRRLRLALKLFGEVIPAPEIEEFRGELQWAIGSLSLARDWDVLCGAILAPLAEGNEVPAGIGPLSAAAAMARRLPATRALDSLRSVRFSRMILGLCSWLEEGTWHTEADTERRRKLDEPMTALSVEWLDALAAKVRKAAKDVEIGETADTRKLRSRLRRLATAANLFRGLHPPGLVRPFVGALDPLLDSLDAQHDHATARQLLESLAEMVPADPVIAVLDGRTRRVRQDLAAQWLALRDLPAFWR